MDNITHTLIGITAAQGLGRNAEPRVLKALTWTSILASNFPDGDFVLGRLAGGGSLGYLLQHRGYTHTLIATIPMALISGWAGARLAGFAGHPLKPENRKHAAALFGMALFGALLHIGADAWNDYGVHPFYPFNNHWFYGDFVFIIEPLLIFAMLPFAFAQAGSKATRVGWGLIGALLLGMCWFLPYMSWPVALAVTLWAALHAWAQKTFRGAAPAVTGCLAVLAAFAAGSHQARALVNGILRSNPVDTPLQLISSPAPSNPFCWRVLDVSVQAQNTLVERIGAVSLWPGVFPPERCVHGLETGHTAPVVPSMAPTTPEVHWVSEFRGELNQLLPLLDTNCRMKALMKFARAPFWVRDPVPGADTIAGDLRYDRDKSKGFARIELNMKEAGKPCPEHVPPWEPNFGFRYVK